MRSLLLLVVALSVGACDLQPPPKQKPTPTRTPPAPGDVPPPPPLDPGSGAAPAAPVDAAVAPPAPIDAMETTAACNEVGVKIATSLIDNAQDAAQKATLVQERDRIVRRVAEACTRDSWPEASRDCFLKAKTQDEMQICGQNLAAPRED